MTDKKNRNEYFRQYRKANRDTYNAYIRNYNEHNKLKNYRRLAAYYKRKAEELEALKIEEVEGNQGEENIDGKNEP